jgi:3D (Asp-Asp-Asp) domain-containing protein
MMRYCYNLILVLGAVSLPAKASTALDGQVGACAAKGGRGVPSPLVAQSKPAPTDAHLSTPVPVKQPKAAQSWIVITPRLPEPGDTHRKSVASTTNTTYSSVSRSAAALSSRLARVTAYWACEGDYYTRHGIASTGVRLHDGHCAVDPNIIPYGSVVDIAGVGKFLAVDTGTAVIERTAAREAGHTAAERNALVIDLYFESRRDGEAFASSAAKWAPVSWWTPGSNATQAKQARGMFAEEDWTKIQSKQL